MTPPSYNDSSPAPEFPPKWRWVQYLLEHYGVPTMVLMLGCWWFATRIAEPLVKSHVEFVQRQAETAREIVDTQKTQAKTLEKASETLGKLEGFSVRVEQAHERQCQALESISKKTP